jgi:hypothetical protein
MSGQSVVPTRPWPIRSLVAAAVLSSLLPPALYAQERFSLSGDVALFNLAGEVVVEAGDGGAVVVEVTRGGRDAERLDIATLDVSGWQAVRIGYPEDRIIYPKLGRGSNTSFSVREDGTFGGGFEDADASSVLRELLGALGVGGDRRRINVRGSGNGFEAWADVRVRVPRGHTVAINLGAGEIRAANVDGSLYLHARSGSVTTSGTRGDLDIDTGSGSVAVNGATGNVLIDTGSGSVRAAGISGGDLSIDTGSGGVTARDLDVGDLEIDTGSGSIDIDEVSSPRIEAETGSGGISISAGETEELMLDTGSGSIEVALRSSLRSAEIDTGSGSVTLVVPSGLNAELVLDSGAGGVDVDLPVRILDRERNFLRAIAGSGGGTISIDTGSGAIRIRSN